MWLDMAGHGGANRHLQLGNGLLPVEAGWRTVAGEPRISRANDSRSGSEKPSVGGALL